ncbi:MAG: hypothetical protein WBG92_09685 [Thiohalocapsa sp.]
MKRGLRRVLPLPELVSIDVRQKAYRNIRLVVGSACTLPALGAVALIVLDMPNVGRRCRERRV